MIEHEGQLGSAWKVEVSDGCDMRPRNALVMLGMLLVFLAGCNDGRTTTEGQRSANDEEVTGAFTEDALPVRWRDRYGYINREGQLCIRLQFEDAKRFHGEVAAGKTKDGWGLINKSGRFVTRSDYDQLSHCIGTTYVCRNGKRWGFLDRDGNETVVPKVTWIGNTWKHTHPVVPFQIRGGEVVEDDSYRRLPSNGVWGYLRPNGEVAIPAQYEMAKPFGGSRAAVKIDGKWAIIDTQGRIVVEPRLEEAVVTFCEGRIPQIRARVDGKYGVLGFDGQWLIAPKFEVAATIGSDWTETKLDGQWVFIDAEGTTRLTMADTEVPDAEPCGPFLHGLAAVRVNGHRIAWINKAGQVSVGPVPGLYSHGFHKDGVAALTYSYDYENDDGYAVRSAIINRQGEYVLEPGPWRVVPMFLFRDRNYVPCRGTGIKTYVDTKGRFLWLPEGHPWAKR